MRCYFSETPSTIHHQCLAVTGPGPWCTGADKKRNKITVIGRNLMGQGRTVYQGMLENRQNGFIERK
jgi:hypothetical protein